MMSDTGYRELLLGAGHSRRKQYMASPNHPLGWRNPQGPVTLDNNPRCRPDIWCDLNAFPLYGHSRDVAASHPDFEEYTGVDGKRRYYAKCYELESDYWDEIHAYQVLEHLGQQGDADAFFQLFSELWRILKPDGWLVGACPSRHSPWLLGDPSHRRAILPETLIFLDQSEYIKQLDCRPQDRTSMSDFRNIYKADFKIAQSHDNRQDHVFVLKPVKPSRWRDV